MYAIKRPAFLILMLAPLHASRGGTFYFTKPNFPADLAPFTFIEKILPAKWSVE